MDNLQSLCRSIRHIKASSSAGGYREFFEERLTGFDQFIRPSMDSRNLLEPDHVVPRCHLDRDHCIPDLDNYRSFHLWFLLWHPSRIICLVVVKETSKVQTRGDCSPLYSGYVFSPRIDHGCPWSLS